MLFSVLSPWAAVLSCVGEYCSKGSRFWLWLQLCCARLDSAFTTCREQDSTSLTLFRNLSFPGHTGYVLLGLLVRGGNLAADVSVVTNKSGAETWPRSLGVKVLF